ncbi:SusD/RagB family nutrient-binding outer membrane lipoprotein [Fulvivirga kasyanovii]|uniref:SusD/RagB family nutrient-binding outer membrane lipoprotein n=1 Tax=Fulvivirga kasyanovii TaxID=396812 RepID=A0ABW9RVG4_9BACT|nr:SusD/RagB family nutrient-binding outer membrane lipoprotein [Fulvivirga kasyanovii]MTI26990.1 SusD/RagB family nutrient-binding outer membrane lipoprotein [Fulvivirga kasyanovii]
MKKINIKILGALLLIFLAGACDDDFQEINKNPNSPEDVPPSLLLPTIIKNPVNESAGLAWGYGNVVMQYTGKIQFTNEDRYNWGPQGDPYNTFFTALRDVNNILQITEESGENNYRGVALVMKSWMYHVMTDAYGDVPYSEALQAKDGVSLPAFDPQSDVYTGILADLQKANELLGTSGEALEGDILYEGDVNKWKKFANSLRLRILMRLSDRVDPSSAMQAILNDPATPVFESNEDQASLTYLLDAPNQQPLYTTRSGSFDEYRLSENMEAKLKALNDPRLYVYAQPTTASEAGLVGAPDDYEGVPNGLPDEEALQYSPSGDPEKGGSNFISRVGLMFSCRACDELSSPIAAETVIMSYAELQFILAEARERGFISTGAAEDYYMEGISSTFDYYESRLQAGGFTELAAVVQPEAGYFAQADVAYTGTQEEKLQKIGTQKWIALFFNGMEAWFDWRRTGYPEITPGPGAVINTVPVRFQYPSDAQALNAEAYEAAIKRQGADLITTRVWWDVD